MRVSLITISKYIIKTSSSSSVIVSETYIIEKNQNLVNNKWKFFPLFLSSLNAFQAITRLLSIYLEVHVKLFFVFVFAHYDNLLDTKLFTIDLYDYIYSLIFVPQNNSSERIKYLHVSNTFIQWIHDLIIVCYYIDYLLNCFIQDGAKSSS